MNHDEMKEWRELSGRIRADLTPADEGHFVRGVMDRLEEAPACSGWARWRALFAPPAWRWAAALSMALAVAAALRWGRADRAPSVAVSATAGPTLVWEAVAASWEDGAGTATPVRDVAGDVETVFL